MPVLKHAKKKLRQDKKRTIRNKTIRELYKKLVKKAKAAPTIENVGAAYSALDKAAKQNIIHKNKAARLKSSLTKKVTGDTKPNSAKASSGEHVRGKTEEKAEKKIAAKPAKAAKASTKKSTAKPAKKAK